MLSGRGKSYHCLGPQHLFIPRSKNMLVDVSNDGRIRTSKNSLLHESNKKADKNSQNQPFQNSRNGPKACLNLFYLSPKEFMQEKGLNLKKNV